MSGTVLVVDDDVEIRQLLSMMLSLLGYETATAVDGIDALEKIKRCQPDVLILDVMMPNMDGLTLCQKLRQQPDTVDLPIIMLSGKAHHEAVNEGLKAGADRYLTKPASMEEITRNIREVLADAPHARVNA